MGVFDHFVKLSLKGSKERSGASKIKSSTENSASMIYKSFILELFILVLTLQSYIVNIKNKTQSSYQSLVLTLYFAMS